MREGSRVFIRPPSRDDWPELLALHQRSQWFHQPWASLPLTESECKRYISRCHCDETFQGWLICHQTHQQIIGVANLSLLVYRLFQRAHLGYYVDIDFAGQGFMSAGLQLVLDHAFYQLGVHQIEANIQPDNTASIKLVKRLGFTRQGVSRRYLKINNDWCDHEHWCLRVEDWAE
ncbi:Putative ribosomal-protein-alanine acetyltransferase [Halomicronema hongdechloris C2206]|uniref:Ribosomal-protein-alanine acetyltransferase n=1 Tax=Halomicronema hongdechloris C2206 TaxID=1641165 RepID=A0A1Z3HL04_9CYAN|nr:GNAT family N-acetyltransferase [Halomicronema hongdechloris]ASC70991.1 Putative ribosomal-protein-alanine acetyltransferase [Halomicronema hongdechloris C2206]